MSDAVMLDVFQDGNSSHRVDFAPPLRAHTLGLSWSLLGAVLTSATVLHLTANDRAGVLQMLSIRIRIDPEYAAFAMPPATTITAVTNVEPSAVNIPPT